MDDTLTVDRVLAALGVEQRQSNGPDNWLISAPYREDRHPSCSIHRASGLWNDKATGQTGDLATLVMLTRGIDRAAALALIERCGGQPSPPGPPPRGYPARSHGRR